MLGRDVPPPHQVEGVAFEHPDGQNLDCNLSFSKTPRPVLQLHNLFFALGDRCVGQNVGNLIERHRLPSAFGKNERLRCLRRRELLGHEPS